MLFRSYRHDGGSNDIMYVTDLNQGLINEFLVSQGSGLDGALELAVIPGVNPRNYKVNVAANTWHYVVLMRSGTRLYFYVNGISYFQNAANDYTGQNFGIGLSPGAKFVWGGIAGTGYGCSGLYLDEIRVSSIARYPTGQPIAVPTTRWPRGPVPGDGDPLFANVALGLHFDGTNGSTSFPDATGRAGFSAVSGAALTTANKKFGTA